MAKSVEEIKTYTDVVFMCRKCQHEVYMDIDSRADCATEILREFEEMECPNCGEDPYLNWRFRGFGNFNKECKN